MKSRHQYYRGALPYAIYRAEWFNPRNGQWSKAGVGIVIANTGLKPGEFVHTFGDLHLYSNHVQQAKLQLAREPRPLPTMKINSAVKNVRDFKFEDFELVGYDPHPAIKAPVAV